AGLKVVESAATKSAEVQGATRALEGAVAVAEESKLPLFTADTDSVSRGSIAALGFNYYYVGKQTGEIVVRVLKGDNPGDIA
ncbi:ABC transporter substrate binding protein, partial [Rhizobium leguminosarum]|uniref:ABC transporter substrate binding protein n=1 Tax=Rhizobium leguminosarum TaxID=384 RepID=UPI003F97538B